MLVSCFGVMLGTLFLLIIIGIHYLMASVILIAGFTVCGIINGKWMSTEEISKMEYAFIRVWCSENEPLKDVVKAEMANGWISGKGYERISKAHDVLKKQQALIDARQDLGQELSKSNKEDVLR